MILEQQPKTFVIAIKDHPISEKQLKDCLESAERFKWDVEVFWGVRGDSITDIMWKEEGINPRLDKPTMHKKGVQGCFFSHFRLWKKCIELNEPIVILEHDAIITAPWPTIEIDDHLIKLHRYYKIKNQKFDKDSGLWSPSAHAYCLLPHHAEILINAVKKYGAFEIDRLIGDKFIKYSHLGHPPLVDRQNNYSTTNNL